DGSDQGTIINLTDKRAEKSRRGTVDLLSSLGPDGVARELVALEAADSPAPEGQRQLALPHLVMPHHHDVRSSDVLVRRLHGALAAAADRGPEDFAELLMVPGVGARTVEALALVAEVVHGAPCRFSDPGRFSYAHGGKDRHPFPVPLKVYDETLKVMKGAIERAKLGQRETLDALKRLDDQSRLLERAAKGDDFESMVDSELARSPELGGRSVFGWEAELVRKEPF
ncbi:MAG: DUF763 domain-containing protein, partial [Alphaproteobacteria bacterium]|nr:DUF763 domain-containing protein [Alphaproteobacteria bacterium]